MHTVYVVHTVYIVHIVYIVHTVYIIIVHTVYVYILYIYMYIHVHRSVPMIVVSPVLAKSRGFSFKSLIPSNPTKMTKMSLDRVLAAARFYHLCVESLPQMSTEILIGLSCNHKLPSRLWYFLSGVLGVQVKDCISALMSPSTDRHASVIMIMCKVTQYLLR